jgi:hypothetical protein
MEYCLIDCTNALVYGPYETLNEASAHADALPAWGIIDGNGDLIDWSRGSVQETAEEKSSKPRKPETMIGNGANIRIAGESDFLLTVHS